jgi:ADP-ribosylglycohydrolase
MPGWHRYRELILTEFEQSVEEGRDRAAVEALRPDFEAAGNDEVKLKSVWQRMLALPIRADFPFVEPDDLAAIKAERSAAVKLPALALSDDALYDRLYGAWLARCCGCALGKPVEPFMSPRNGLSSRQRVKEYLLGAGPGEWPLKDYVPARSSSEEKTGSVEFIQSTRESIAFMESDDDIRYTVIGQLVLLRNGLKFSTLNVAQAWMWNLPYRTVCTAETQAYRNLVTALEFHAGIDVSKAEQLDWHWVATHENPYREWIGADIRIDSYGYACPGNPELAAELAWRDARLSHVKNGLYGAMLFSAMIAAAFVTDDVRLIVEAGLAQIPQRSRLAKDMRQTIALCEKHGCDAARFEDVLIEIEKAFGHYSPVHTNNNAALVVAALLLGKGDMEKAITIAVMGGWDTDCTGATAGSIVGAMVGASKLPSKWTGRLNDTLNAELTGYHPAPISACARKSLQIVQKSRV